MGALYPSGHALHIPWLKSGWGADQSGSHQALSSRSSNVPCPCEILLQSCYHQVALNALLHNCWDVNYSVYGARWRYHICYNSHRKICYLLNTSAWGRAWAEVLDGLMPQELEDLLSDITSRQRVMWFGDDQQGLSRPLEVSRLCFEM